MSAVCSIFSQIVQLFYSISRSFGKLFHPEANLSIGQQEREEMVIQL